MSDQSKMAGMLDQDQVFLRRFYDVEILHCYKRLRPDSSDNA